MGYRRAALAGVGWHTLLKLSTTALTAGKLIILARLLTPQDFGVFSLVTIALGLTEAATETGINVFLIQTSEKVNRYIDTAWIIAIARGLLIAGVMISLGHFMGGWYQEPSLWWLVTLAALVPFIKGFINPSITFMQKELKFGRDSLYRVSLSVVEVILSVTLVWLSPQVDRLIWAMIGAAVFEVVISLLMFKDRPRWHWRWSVAQEIFGHAKWLNLTSLLSYLHENGDNIVLGKMFGTQPLGYYQNAYALSHKANYDLTQSINHSTFPVLTKLKDDHARLWKAFWQSRAASLLGISLVSLPLWIYPQLVVILLGEQWVSAIPLIQPLTLAGLLQGTSLLMYTMLLTTRNYRWLNAHLGLVTVTTIMSLVLFGSSLGLVGSAWLIVGSRLICLPIVLLGLQRSYYDSKHSS